MGRLPDLPVIAAVRDQNGRGHDTSETWALCASEKQVLEHPDEDVIWVTDEESLVDTLHQRTEGSDQHTFVVKDEYLSSVYVKTIPRWLGPLDPKLLLKFLEKHPTVCLPIGPGEIAPEKTWRSHRHFLTKFRKLPIWEHYEAYERTDGIHLQYTPDAGERRRTYKANDAAFAKQNREERQAFKKAHRRYITSISVKELGCLSVALHHALCQQLPKKVAAALGAPAAPSRRSKTFGRTDQYGSRPGARKSKIIEHIILCGGLLRVLENPHHKKLPSAVRKALQKLIPHIKELKSKVIPFSDLSNYLSEEVVLLAKAGYSLEA